MRRIFLFVVLLVFGLNNLYSQTLWDSIIEVKRLIYEEEEDAAEALLNRIEKQCLNTDNDSIRVMFVESKGIFLWGKDRYEECIPYFQNVIDLYEKLQIKGQNYLDAFVAIGYSYGRLKDYENAEKFYRKALLKSVSADFNEEFRPNVYINLGNLYMEKGDTILANECYSRARAENAEKFDFMAHNYFEWKISKSSEITSLIEAQKYQDAADKCAEMVQGIEKKEGKNETYILYLSTKANLLSRYLNEYEAAKPLYEEIIEWGRNRIQTNECVCCAYCNLALYYAVNDKFSKTDTIIEKGIQYLKIANFYNYPPHSIYRFAGDGAYWNQNHAMAIKYYEQYLNKKYRREQGTKYDETVNQISVSYILSGNPEKAKTLLLGFLRTDEARLEKDDKPILANIYHNLGRAIMLGGNKSEALKYLNMSKEIQLTLSGNVADRTLQYINECSLK